MSDTFSASLIGALAALVGASLGYLSTRLSEDRRLSSEREGRKEALNASRDEFQRQTLLDVQDAFTGFVRAVGEAYVAIGAAGEKHAVDEPAPGVQRVGDDLYDRMVRLASLTERVRDDNLRRVLHSAQQKGLSAANATDFRRAQERISLFQVEIDAVNASLGPVLRRLL